MLQGTVIGREFVVVDAFALPVEGTETRVNAQTEAYEYMVDFAETTKVCRCSYPLNYAGTKHLVTPSGKSQTVQRCVADASVKHTCTP